MTKYGYRAILHTLGEESSIALNQLASHGGGSQLDESIAAVALIGANGDLLNLIDSHLGCPPQTLDDDLRANTLLDVLLNLLQELTGENNDRCSTVTDLGVLRSSDIDEDSGSGVNNIEELCLVSNGMGLYGSSFGRFEPS
jgi:hypothetical protein